MSRRADRRRLVRARLRPTAGLAHMREMPPERDLTTSSGERELNGQNRALSPYLCGRVPRALIRTRCEPPVPNQYPDDLKTTPRFYRRPIPVRRNCVASAGRRASRSVRQRRRLMVLTPIHRRTRGHCRRRGGRYREISSRRDCTPSPTASYILTVARRSGVVERYTLSAADRDAIRVDRVTASPEVIEPRNDARNAFIRNQTLLGLVVYAPAFAGAVGDNGAGYTAAYLVVAGGSFFAASEISRRISISTAAERSLVQHRAERSACRLGDDVSDGRD